MDDYYSNPDDAEEESNDSPVDEKKSEEGETTLVPKSIFGSYECKVGDVKKFKVEHIYEDEVELSYVGKESKDEGPTMEKAQEELGMMAQEED